MKIQNVKSLTKWQNQKPKHIKRMNNNYQIPDVVQAFSYVEKSKITKIPNSDENSKRKVHIK